MKPRRKKFIAKNKHPVIDSLIIFLVSCLILFTSLIINTYSCSASVNRNLTLLNPPSVINVTVTISDHYGYGVSSPISNDGFIELTVSGGIPPYTYTWSNNAISQNIYNLSGGNYGVCILDSIGTVQSLFFELTEPSQQIINIPSGWSIFSTYIQPMQPEISEILEPIIGNIIIAKDGNGNAYWPLYFLDMIGNITTGQGYMIKINNSCNLEILGEILQPEVEIINLPSSWSIIGYLRTDSAPVIEMFLPITTEIAIVKDYLGMVYWPAMGLDLIGYMNPGKGYQINMLTSQSFSYPANDTISEIVICPPGLTDYDGNNYNIVQIGNQCWMSENLKVTHFADGSSLINGNGVGNTSNDYTTKYYFDYDDNSSNSATYGKLYSWAAMLDGVICGSFNTEDRQGVCPTGWHIPDNNDWTILQGTIDTLYNENDSCWTFTGDLGTNVGGAMKENLFSHWNFPNTGANNSSGFSALPAGYRISTGTYLYQETQGYFWSSQANCLFYGWYRNLSYNKATIYKNFMSKGVALSVRCLKD